MLYTAFHKAYNHAVLPEGHKFPMLKYDLLKEQLLHQGIIEKHELFTPSNLASDEDILRVHHSEYLDKLHRLDLNKIEERRTGFPLSKELIEREKLIMQGGIDASVFALENNGISMNIAGGTHHAYSNQAEGFCLLNDIAISAAKLIADQGVKKILIIDLDVHQGNGTAEIFSNRDDVFTFSVHGRNNYPFKKEKSDLDIALEDNITDEEYLFILHKHLPDLLNKLQPQFVFYQCGVDVLASDKLGKLGLTLEGCRARDRMVLELTRSRNIPMHCCMGGGYSKDLKTIVDAHSNTFKEALNHL
jgi:acetoin utilization deacetylase AcuC-like enzyme